jgi:hypothetical protein
MSNARSVVSPRGMVNQVLKMPPRPLAFEGLSLDAEVGW